MIQHLPERLIPRRLLPKRRPSLAREFRDSCRAGPRAWFMVGVALLLTAVFQKLIWLALVLWLLFVLPAVIGGLLSWLVAECIRWMRTARPLPPEPRPAAPERMKVEG